METMEVCGRNYPVIGYVEDETLGTVPLLDIPMMSDYNWQLRPLQSRLKNPELYRLRSRKSSRNYSPRQNG